MKNLQQLHKSANAELKKAAQDAINSNKLRQTSKKLAAKYNISSQTVVNYVYGQGRDGFLKKCLTDDFINASLATGRLKEKTEAK